MRLLQRNGFSAAFAFPFMSSPADTLPMPSAAGFPTHMLLTATLLGVLTGCSALQRQRESGASADRKDSSQKLQSGSLAENPFRRSGTRKNAQRRPDDAAGSADVKHAAENHSPGDSPGKIVHDGETLKLIEHELRDINPIERQRILSELKQAKPEAVRYYLRLLRSQRKMRALDGNLQQAGNLSASQWSRQSNSSTATRQLSPHGRDIFPFGHSDGGEPPATRQVAGTATEKTSEERWQRLPASRAGGPHPETPTTADTATGDRENPSWRGRLLGGILPERPSTPAAGNPDHSRNGQAGSPFSLSRFRFNRRSSTHAGEADKPEKEDTSASGPSSPAAEWDESLRRLISIADARASASASPTPRDELDHVRRHVHLRLLYLMANQQQQAMDPIPGIPSAEQEFWQHLLWGMADYFRDDSISDRHSRATQAVSQLRTAIERLRSQADLEIRNLVFCRKITSFGTYETVPQNQFRAGEQVLIYTELDNFKSELTEEGQYRTRLKSTIEIYPDVVRGGERPIKRFDFSPTEDICRRNRRDYFHSYIINLPANLPLGDYRLKLIVEDQLGGKMATDTIRFRIN